MIMKLRAGGAGAFRKGPHHGALTYHRAHRHHPAAGSARRRDQRVSAAVITPTRYGATAVAKLITGLPASGWVIMELADRARSAR